MEDHKERELTDQEVEQTANINAMQYLGSKK
jgi:hypothetical protein